MNYLSDKKFNKKFKKFIKKCFLQDIYWFYAYSSFYIK